MLWTLTRKELLSSLLTMRLAVALVFTVLLAVLTSYIGTLEYSRNVEAYRQRAAEAEAGLDEAQVYRQAWHTVVVPPEPVTILARGISEASGHRVRVMPWFIQLAAWPLSHGENDRMRTLERVDLTTVISLLLSFLAVVLGFDGISGERERGTLGLLLANSVSRASVVGGKLLGGILSLWVPLAVAYLLSLLILNSSRDVTLQGDDWVLLGIYFALACLFLAQVFSLSLMVSACTRSSATSLIICLFGWLAAGVGYLNVVPALSRYGIDEPPYQEYVEQERAFWDEFEREMEEWSTNNPAPGPAYMKAIERDGMLFYGRRERYDWRARRTAVELDKILETSDRMAQAQWANWQPLAREAFLVDEWSVLSPIANFKTLAKELLGTTLDCRLHLGRKAREYRSTLIDWLRARGAFSDPRWFTSDPPDQHPLITDPEVVTPEMLDASSEFMKSRMRWVEEQDRRARADARRHLDLSDMPRFGAQWRRTPGESLASMLPGLAVLSLTLILSAMITLYRFLRYEPAQ